MSYLFLLTFFFAAAHFHLGSRQHFSSHHRYKIVTFFFQRNWSPLFFISRCSSFSFIHVNIDIKIQSKEIIGFVVVVFFLSKSPGGHAIYPRNARVLETQNFTPAYMKGVDVRTDVRTIFSEPKFLGCIDNQIFLPVVLRCALRARESSAKNTNFLTENVNSSLIYHGSPKPNSTENEIYLI